MINQSTINDVLTIAVSTGGNFAEVFLENRVDNGLSMINGIVEKASGGINFGLGLRIFDNGSGIYAYTNDTSYENLIKVAKSAASAVNNKSKSITIMPFINQEIENKHIIKHIPTVSHKKEAVEKLRKISDTSFNSNKLITETSGSYLDYIQDVVIANTDGMWTTDRRVRTRFTANAVASDGNDKDSSMFSKGGYVGFELFDDYNMEEIGEDLANNAITCLRAKPCPSGKMPVIINNGFGGVIFHEACGHSLEATAIAKDASVFCGKMNKVIANEKLTAIDDGTIINEWGSINIDDEGTPAKKNVLIKDGVLKSYLVDKLNGEKLNMPSTGSSRRESYRFAPTSRMTNTYIDNGNDSIDDIFASVEYGLYAKSMGGGSVVPTTGEFNFAVREGFIVRNGKIAEAVKGATLIGKGHEVLMDIDMISNNLEKSPGMCGSISGSIPTNVGQPTLRVSKLTVGGNE